MRNAYQKFLDVKKQIAEIKISTKDTVLYLIFSILASLLLFCGPIAVLINCLIFVDYQTLIFIGLGICIFGVLFFSRFFYYEGITKKQIENMKYFYLFDSISVLIITIVLVIIFVF